LIVAGECGGADVVGDLHRDGGRQEDKGATVGAAGGQVVGVQLFASGFHSGHDAGQAGTLPGESVLSGEVCRGAVSAPRLFLLI
jgi:hypothetical protein